jgi:Protein of unknown function (DUF2628)
MAVYTVHEPPSLAADDAAEFDRFKFVRDGFSFWAFLFGPFWMAWHGLWLVLICYLVIMGGFDAAMMGLGVSPAEVFVAGVLIALLVGLEAATLRRFTLARRGWRYVGLASGESQEAAERRFFTAWARDRAAKPPAPSMPPPLPRPAAAPVSRMPQASGVIGLFPEPGAQR